MVTTKLRNDVRIFVGSALITLAFRFFKKAAESEWRREPIREALDEATEVLECLARPGTYS